MFPQSGRVVLVMLKDGRQLEGERAGAGRDAGSRPPSAQSYFVPSYDAIEPEVKPLPAPSVRASVRVPTQRAISESGSRRPLWKEPEVTFALVMTPVAIALVLGGLGKL